MEISIKNFAAIADAKVNISGLTVIAGENDTGKSTVGKLLFSYVLACSRTDDYIIFKQQHTLFEAIEKVYFELRRSIDMSKFKDLQQAFLPKEFLSSLKGRKGGGVDEWIKLITEVKNEFDDDSQFQLIVELIKAVEGLNNTKPVELYEGFVDFFNSVLKQEFGGFIGDMIDEKPAHVTINDGKTTIFDGVFEKEELNYSVVELSNLSDITLVDTGAILQFQQLLDVIHSVEADSFEGVKNSGIQLHSMDLIKKLKDSVYFEDDKQTDTSSRIRQLFNGQLLFDKETKSFVLQRNEKTIKLQNVASGIKVLGITDMLLKGGHFDANKLVILDEPEVNLHPKWQIEYARIICQLVKAGANILVTTHSPYMFEALSGFSKQQDIDGSFYLAEQSEEGAVFSDVSMDTSGVIERLSKPLIDLNEELYGDF